MMPEDLIKTLSPQDVADVLAWLRTPPTSVVLIDDDPSITNALTEGEGTATMIFGDASRGNGSLQITPPQRNSPQISGWQYRIREKPGLGEFRYLRFAWKSVGANGIMLELASDGEWLVAGLPLRRYASGHNTTGWQAVQISPEVPQKWVTVTRDLWQDFGDLTITGIAPTVCGGAAHFDQVELLRSLQDKSVKH